MLKLVIATIFLCAAVAKANAADLSGQEINELLAGATVELDTPVGTKLPVRYGADGKLAGEAGDLAWYLGAATDRGKWWVEGDELCHRWSQWFNSEKLCLRLRKDGRLVRWRTQDGNAGTATITVPAPKQVAVAMAGVVPGRPKGVPAPKPAPAPVKAAPDVQPDPPTPGEVQPAPPDAPVAKSAPSQDKPASVADPTPPVPVLVSPDTGLPQVKPEPKSPEPKSVAKSTPKSTARSDAAAKADGQAEPKRPAQQVYRVANVRGDDVLNVRSGPSADFEIVGALPPGTRGIAIVSACRSQWCPVRHDAMSGWVNRIYLAPEWNPGEAQGKAFLPDADGHDAPNAPRSCLTPAARALLARIEQQFGPVQVISTCRAGVTIPGSWRPSLHASGNAVDFKAGSRKAAIIAWLIANHRRGGTMTYAGMEHIHVDIGPHYVSIAGGPRWASWRDSKADFPGSR